MEKTMIIGNMTDVLNDADYSPTDYALSRIADEWTANKRATRDLLSRHPAWNEKRLAVVLNSGWTRPTDAVGASRFMRWIAERNVSISFGTLNMLVTDAVAATTDGATIVTDEIATAINKIIDDHCDGVRYRVTAGMKVSRAINKLCVLIGADKDDDYNRMYAAFGDASSAMQVTRPTLLSVNPVDYLTMSRGNRWHSCHDIRNKDDAGCYSSGTLSYMLDTSSIVCFTLKSADDVENIFADKLQRNMIHIAPDGRSFIQGRVYPQENDGAADLYAEWRHIVQDVIADCIGVPSLWNVKKGTATCKEWTDTDGTHYPDYHYFDNCNLSTLKNTTPRMIPVGHDPICPECGAAHTVQDNVCCNDCRDVDTCAYCGDVINDYDSIYVEAAGASYCCSECAERDGYIWCGDIEEYAHEDDVYRDDYDGECFANTHDMVQTENGDTFRNPENALAAGFDCTDDGEWYPADEIRYCDHCGCSVHVNDYNDDVDACCYCAIELIETEIADGVPYDVDDVDRINHVDGRRDADDSYIMYNFPWFAITAHVGGYVIHPAGRADDIHNLSYLNYHNFLQYEADKQARRDTYHGGRRYDADGYPVPVVPSLNPFGAYDFIDARTGEVIQHAA